MKFFYILALLLGLSLSALSQQTYVSKKQIKIGNYENGNVSIGQTTATFIVKTDFNFKSAIGSHYTLNLITEDSEEIPHHLTLKSVRMKRTEKIYQFAIEEAGDTYPKYFLQITVEPNTNFYMAVVIKNNLGQFTFYCDKI
jgi:hypothetical protein